MEKIGVVTGGGDCPGINAVIRGIVKTALQNKYKVIGLRDGWKGLINDPHLDGSFKINEGLRLARRFLLDVVERNPAPKIS